MIRSSRSVLFSVLLGSCGVTCCLGQAVRAEEAAPKLPGSTKGLGEYLANTVWKLEGGGIFRFRGNGTMVMPWHDFEWKTLGPRKAQMFTKDWRFDIVFSEDMTTLEVPGRYKGKMSERLSSALDDKKLEAAVADKSWLRETKEGKSLLVLAKHGKIQDANKIWTTWEVHDGLLLIRGKEGDRHMQEDYFLQKDEQPYVLCPPGGGDGPKMTRQ